MNRLKYLPYAFTKRAISLWLLVAVLVVAAAYWGNKLGEFNRQARVANEADYEAALTLCLLPASGYSAADCDCAMRKLREREFEAADLAEYAAVAFTWRPTGSVNMITDIMQLNLECCV